MVGMLQAIPKTPLYERLEKEGRLVEEDPNCNFVPQADDPRGAADRVTGSWSSGSTRPRRSSTATSRSTESPSIHARRAPRSRRRPAKARCCRRLAYGLSLLWSLFWALVARRLAAQRRRASTCGTSSGAQPAAIARDIDRLRAVHEPLRDPLALLQVHARRIRGQAAAVQQRLSGRVSLDRSGLRKENNAADGRSARTRC